ncbi:MAG: hypothetical protein KDI59_07365, partial [Xanthomonadales bacterium]|nr:hypothetical protein [Xanthomonadales bacterium]
ADEHAKKEYEQYIEIKKLEHLGLDVDLQLFYSGAYDEYKEETSKIKISDLSSDSKPLIENNIESVFDKSLKQALDFNPKD